MRPHLVVGLLLVLVGGAICLWSLTGRPFEVKPEFNLDGYFQGDILGFVMAIAGVFPLVGGLLLCCRAFSRHNARAS